MDAAHELFINDYAHKLMDALDVPRSSRHGNPSGSSRGQAVFGEKPGRNVSI
jgi:hypothetical protein